MGAIQSLLMETEHNLLEKPSIQFEPYGDHNIDSVDLVSIVLETCKDVVSQLTTSVFHFLLVTSTVPSCTTLYRS